MKLRVRVPVIGEAVFEVEVGDLWLPYLPDDINDLDWEQQLAVVRHFERLKLASESHEFTLEHLDGHPDRRQWEIEEVRP